MQIEELKKSKKKIDYNSINSKFYAFFHSHRPLLKFFLIFSAIYLIGISAILIADVYYADDIGRAERGYTAWAGFSRYISEFLSHIVHADSYLTDVSPLPQILAVFISALSSTLLLYAFVGKKLFSLTWNKYIWLIVAAIPLVLCPYFLECLSYKYDSVYMALSILTAITPVLFRHHKAQIYYPVVFACTLIVCTTYQTSLGILPMSFVFFCFKDWFMCNYEPRLLLKRLGLTAGTMLIALLLFKFCIMSPVDSYISNSFPALEDFIPNFLRNYSTYFGMFLSDFKPFWIVLIAIICVLFAIVSLHKTTRKKLACFIAMIACSGIMILSIFGFYSLFDQPLYAPRAGYCIGAFIAFIGLFVTYYSDRIIPKLIVATLSWCFFVFAFTYGNALGAQDQYISQKFDNVIDSLNNLKLNDNTQILQIEGETGTSPIIKHMPQNFNMLAHLLESSYSDNVIWDSYRLVYLCDFCNFTIDSSQDLTTMDLPLLDSTSEYDIFGDDSHILIYFKTFND